jgi:hypothetical protein
MVAQSTGKPHCKGWPTDDKVRMSVITGQCKKKKQSCSIGSTVNIKCRNNLRLFGPRDVICNEDGWSTDMTLIQCKQADVISDIQAKAVPTITVGFSQIKEPFLTNSKVNLTTHYGIEVGESLSARCEAKWPTNINGVNLPMMQVKWYKVVSNGSHIPVPEEMTSNHRSNISSQTSGKGDQTDLHLTNFQEIGNHTFICKTTTLLSWHLWSPLQATLDIQVTKSLCPPVVLPCNTHEVGQITKENRIESGIVRFQTDPGYAPTDERPLESKCKNGNWDPPFIDFKIQRVQCPKLELPEGVGNRLLDGPSDYSFGARYKLYCNDSTMALKGGDSQVYCTPSGMWDPDPTLAFCTKSE